LRGQTGYQLAAGLAANGPKVLLAPVAFPTEGVALKLPLATAEVAASDPDLRAELWDILTATAAADGITLLPQPEASVTAGCFTRAEFAVAGHVAKKDYEHKNPAYGALVLESALPLLRSARG
jgi:hypothetical protein